MAETVRTEGVLGGRPRIEDRRIGVLDVYEWVIGEGGPRVGRRRLRYRAGGRLPGTDVLGRLLGTDVLLRQRRGDARPPGGAQPCDPRGDRESVDGHRLSERVRSRIPLISPSERRSCGNE